MNRRFSGVLVGGVLASTVIASCASTVSESDLSLPEPNIEQWVLPLDDYREAWDDSTLQRYAEDFLIADCVGASGYELDVPWVDVSDSTRSEHLNAVRRQLFTRDLASRYGYGRPTEGQEKTPEEALFSEQIYAVDDATWDQCLSAARDELDVTPNVAILTQSFAVQAYESASATEPVSEARKRWHECMLPMGVPDLPLDPELMPPASVRSASVDSVAPVASDFEIEVATQDFQCRESSGYRDALYEAEWDEQVQVLRENYDELVRVRALVESERANVYEALGLAVETEGDGES